MSQFHNKDVIQAILIADNNVNNFVPFSNKQSTSLIQLVNVPLLDYALESLNRSEVDEVFVYSTFFINDVREHIKKRIDSCCSWSVKMKVTVIGDEGCRCLGDAIRDLDAKGLIRGHFILMGADTITNANLKPLLEQHKKTAKFDKGTAVTVIFKEASTGLRTGDEIMIAMDVENNRLHFHQRIKTNTKETNFKIPLEIFLTNSQISLNHNLIDPQIAICSPTLLSLFSDNFDFETRDDFIKGLLINEEILDSRIYVAMLPQEQYARKVSNWLTYQITSNDIINRWAYPLVPDMGICCLKQNYLFLRNNIYKSPSANVLRITLKENVVVQENSLIDTGSIVSSSVIGKNCRIGKKCILKNTFLLDNVIIEDNCVLEYCVIGNGVKIGANSNLRDGVVIGEKVIIPQNTDLIKSLVQYQIPDDEENPQKLGNQAYVIDDTEEMYQSDSEDDEIEPLKVGVPKLMKLPLACDDSDYNSTSEEEESRQGSPIPDDTNIFLSEVIDSLTRGFQEKSNTDFLILEINSSRYAYNMTLQEVNFFVVKAVFSLSHIKDSNASNILQAMHQVLSYLGPVVTNYIKTDDAMIDCLKAVEECFNEDEYVMRNQAAKIIHYLYDKEYVTEDAICKWYNELDMESEWLKLALNKLVEWLNQSSEDETSDGD